jgi:hypothetical protein
MGLSIEVTVWEYHPPITRFNRTSIFFTKGSTTRTPRLALLNRNNATNRDAVTGQGEGAALLCFSPVIAPAAAHLGDGDDFVHVA